MLIYFSFSILIAFLLFSSLSLLISDIFFLGERFLYHPNNKTGYNGSTTLGFLAYHPSMHQIYRNAHLLGRVSECYPSCDIISLPVRTSCRLFNVHTRGSTWIATFEFCLLCIVKKQGHIILYWPYRKGFQIYWTGITLIVKV